MNIIYSPAPFSEVPGLSLFLAGPTPRHVSVASWRPEALSLLLQKGFTGTVFVPEPEKSPVMMGNGCIVFCRATKHDLIAYGAPVNEYGEILASSMVDIDRLEGSIFDHKQQVHWEWKALKAATVVLFWIPRDLTLVDGSSEAKMAGWTTNIEAGICFSSERYSVVYGAPKDAPKMRYLDELSESVGINRSFTLEDTIDKAIRGLHHYD